MVRVEPRHLGTKLGQESYQGAETHLTDVPVRAGEIHSQRLEDFSEFLWLQGGNLTEAREEEVEETNSVAGAGTGEVQPHHLLNTEQLAQLPALPGHGAQDGHDERKEGDLVLLVLSDCFLPELDQFLLQDLPLDWPETRQTDERMFQLRGGQTVIQLGQKQIGELLRGGD